MKRTDTLRVACMRNAVAEVRISSIEICLLASERML
jgi:hypothetical protein